MPSAVYGYVTEHIIFSVTHPPSQHSLSPLSLCTSALLVIIPWWWQLYATKTLERQFPIGWCVRNVNKTEGLMYVTSLGQHQVRTYVHVCMRVHRGSRGCLPQWSGLKAKCTHKWCVPETFQWPANTAMEGQAHNTHTITCLYIPTHRLCKICCYDNSTSWLLGCNATPLSKELS